MEPFSSRHPRYANKRMASTREAILLFGSGGVIALAPAGLSYVGGAAAIPDVSVGGGGSLR